MTPIDKKDIHRFIGDEVYYDEYGGGYIWGKKKKGIEMIAQIDIPELGNDPVSLIRGWGAIQNLMKSEPGYAERFQNTMGQWIADAINEKLERERDGK
jgi:hypothetical protein